MNVLCSKKAVSNRRLAGSLLVIAALVLALISVDPEYTVTASASGVPSFNHIFVIVMENHSLSEIIGHAPYIDSLAAQYGLATNYHAVTHPSLPNYLALTGGSTFGVTSDCTGCFQNQPNIAADRISPSGRTWKAYQESMPSACFVGNSGRYVQKHDPLIYYNDIRTVPAQCANIVPYTRLAGDLGSANTTPNYVFITPNLCNDMHDCSIATGDTWLKNNVPLILNSPAYTSQNSAVFIVWDEDDGSPGNVVPNLVIAKSVPKGFRSSAPYTHYSLLKTIEQAWGLAPLTANDGNATALAEFFGGSPPPPSPTPTATKVVTSTPTRTATATSVPSATPTRTPTGVPVTATATPIPATPTFPIRAAFFYPWFPQGWTQGIFPYTNYTPSLGFYDSQNDSTIDRQIQLAAYAHLDAFIGSWWGQGHYTDRALQHILARSSAPTSVDPGLRWAIYYEPEGQGDPTVSQIVADMQYLSGTLFAQPNYLRVGGKPVVFVYANGQDGSGMNTRWAQAKAQLGGNLYTVLKVYAGYRTTANQPDSWHQYAPAVAYDAQSSFSASVSPGFWKVGEQPRLPRDPAVFEANVQKMAASGAAWQLITTWNEWGEGTAVEPASQFGNTYLNSLCRNLPGTTAC